MRALLDKLTTPHPTEKALCVWVPSVKIVPNLEPTRGTTVYKDFKMHPTPNRAEGYADYVFRGCEEGERFRGEDGVEQIHIPYIFLKQRTSEEIATPIEEFPTQRDDFEWPDILEQHDVYCDDPAPEWEDLKDDKEAYVFVLRRRRRPSYRGATNIIVRRYWSHVPWTIEDFESDPMQPNDVEHDLMVLRGVTKRCLHGPIKVPGLAGDGGLGRLFNLSDDDPGSTEVAAYPERNYVATNYTTWADHIFLVTQEPVRFGYVLTTYEAKAPELTEIEEV